MPRKQFRLAHKYPALGMILGHAPVVIQDMLGIAPEALDAVDVIFRSFIDEGTVMAHGMVFPVTFQGLVTPGRHRCRTPSPCGSWS